jgi:hypothetical protein
MSAFDDLMSLDFAALVDPDLTPETEAVTWHKPDGSTATVNAVVRRGPPLVNQAGQTVINVVLVVATASVDAITIGQTRFTVSPRRGGPAVRLAVAEVEEHAAGFWQVRLQ